METPEFYQTDYYNAQFPSEKRLSDAKPTDHFVIEDLLNFPNDDGMGPVEPDPDSSAVDTSCNSSLSTVAGGERYFQAAADPGGPGSFVDGHFSNELCVPYDEELEWLSNFVDESFSSEDLQKLQLIQGMKARTNEVPQAQQYHFQPEPVRSGPMLLSDMSVPAKARSKRSRAAPGSWTSRLLMVSPTPASAAPSGDTPAMSSSSESDMAGAGKKSPKAASQKKKEAATVSENSGGGSAGGEGRKCLHCATDKTPQWRTGPMGPKTLCNACGVRYKSGRLVPEYRPAASPTFVLTKHSNSHRKVLELRRQKEMVRAQHQQQFMHHHQSMMFDVSNADDYLIHQHIGPDYRQMI